MAIELSIKVCNAEKCYMEKHLYYESLLLDKKNDSLLDVVSKVVKKFESVNEGHKCEEVIIKAKMVWQ